MFVRIGVNFLKLFNLIYKKSAIITMESKECNNPSQYNYIITVFKEGFYPNFFA